MVVTATENAFARSEPANLPIADEDEDVVGC